MASIDQIHHHQTSSCCHHATRALAQLVPTQTQLSVLVASDLYSLVKFAHDLHQEQTLTNLI